MKILDKKKSQWLEQFLNSSHIGVLIVDKDRNNLLVNKHLCDMFGYSESELLATTAEIFHVDHQTFLNFAKLAFDFVLRGEAIGIDYQFKHKDGTLFWVRISGDTVQNQEEVLWTMVDITTSVESKNKIEFLKERMELAIEGNRDVIWDWNLSDNTLFVSSKWKEMTGFNIPSASTAKKLWRKLIHPDELRSVLNAISDNIKQKTKYLNIAYRMKHQNGSWIWIHARGKTHYDNAGKAVRMTGTYRDITQDKKLQLKTTQQSQMIERIHDSVISTDLEGNILTWNNASESLLGYSSDEIIGQHITTIYQEDDYENLEKNIEILMRDKECNAQVKLVSKSKVIIDVELSLSLLRDENNALIGMIGYAKNITQRKEAERKMEEANFNFKQYLNAIDDIDIGIFVVNEDFTISYMNRTMIKWFGDQNGKICYSSVANLNAPCPYCKLHDVIHENKQVTYNPTTPSGQSFDISATSIKNADGTTAKMEIIRNITEQKRVQEQLHFQANHDSLTALPNRLLFNDRLEQAIQKAKRSTHKVALLFIDLDHFKEINDSLGHKVGDEVLIIVTQRLKDAIRKEDSLARLGGDEFTVIVEELSQVQDVSLIAQKILEALATPLQIDKHELYVSSSIGISLYPEDGSTSHDLLKYADTAMYKAKDEGRNNFQYYSSEMTELAFERVVMEASLRASLKSEDFVVYYQPQIDASTNRLIGMEALVRWKHPIMGIVNPARFIPLAESTGLIVELDRFVMRTAMKQLVEWYNEGLNPGTLALNLSVNQLQQKDFIDVLKDMIKETNCSANHLELEVTESQIMKDPEEAIKILQKISDIGIELAVDDFGTGYSSLAYLKKLPINKLKIDQLFVRDLPKDEEDSSIVKAIIAIAESLNLRLIAEGVEQEGQKKFLVENGCSNIQGYIYSKPIPAQEFKELFLKDKML